jgi:hypothetical protein
MSANNQIIVAPDPKDLTHYAVWMDSCVDNPFDFGRDPIGSYSDLEEAMDVASKVMEDQIVEYGIHFLPKSSVSGYSRKTFDHDPDPEIAYTYLGPDGPKGEHDPHTEFHPDFYKDQARIL